MILRRCHMVWVAAVFACWVNAAPSYHTPCLERLAGLTGLVLPDSLGAGVDVDSTWHYRGKVLRVRTNRFGDVSHIGYKLFDTRWATTYEFRPVLDFVERYALEEDVLSPDDKAEFTSRKAVTFLQGNATMLKSLTPQTPVRIQEKERRGYQLEWGEGEGKVCLMVLADCQTILGVNLIELEMMLERDLLRTSAALVGDSLPVAWHNCPVSLADQVAVADGGTFLSDLICSRLYLRKDGQGEWHLLWDENRPRQTLTNLLLTGFAPWPVPLKLTLDKYGYVKKELSVTLQQFVSYCENEGCRLYLGIKESGENRLSVTLFAVHTGLAYCHTLSMSVPVGWLQGKGDLTGMLYAFTPLQNITEKFFITNPIDKKHE